MFSLQCLDIGWGPSKNVPWLPPTCLYPRGWGPTEIVWLQLESWNGPWSQQLEADNHIPRSWAASPLLKGYLQVKIYIAFLYKLYLEISNVGWEDIFFIEEFKLGRIMELEYYNFATSNNKFRQWLLIAVNITHTQKDCWKLYFLWGYINCLWSGLTKKSNSNMIKSLDLSIY